MEPADRDLGPLKRTLGDLLAGHRGSAGLTQRELARAVGYARASVAGAETGARVPAQAFWHRCDRILGAGGDLIRAYGQLAAARGARRKEAAAQDQAERAARATALPPAWQMAVARANQQFLPVGPVLDQVDITDHLAVKSAGLGQPWDVASRSDGTVGLMEKGCAEWLAWHMWRHRRGELHVSELPAPMARYLNVGSGCSAAGVLSPGGLIACDPDGAVAFVQPDHVDLFVGRRVFRDIASGSNRLLGTGQTTHQTDLVVQQYVSQHDASVLVLREWATKSNDSLVRVNSGGILAKLGRDELVDEVAVSLMEHRGARTLYVTAVISRVLGRPWSEAESLAAQIEDPRALSLALSTEALDRIARELNNTHDGVARWCSAVVLGAHGTPSDSVRASLQHALMTERSRESLRAIGTALSGTTPIAS